MLYEYLHKKFDILQASEFKYVQLFDETFCSDCFQHLLYHRAHEILEEYLRRQPANKVAKCRCR